jgi:hypothetical protein
VVDTCYRGNAANWKDVFDTVRVTDNSNNDIEGEEEEKDNSDSDSDSFDENEISSNQASHLDIKSAVPVNSNSHPGSEGSDNEVKPRPQAYISAHMIILTTL